MGSLYGKVKQATGSVLNESLEYCKHALQSVSRSFALTIPLVEDSILAPIMVGYLEARILDTFEDEVGKRRISLEERVTYMNAVMDILETSDTRAAREKVDELSKVAVEVVGNAKYRDLVQNFDQVLTVHRSLDERTRDSMVRWLHEMNAGMKKFLKNPVHSFDDLNNYCYYVAGVPSGFLTELIVTKAKHLTESSRKTLLANERDFGLFLQKVNIIRDFREDIKNNERIFWPQAGFEKAGLEPPDLLLKKNRKAAMQFLVDMVENAEKHIEPVKAYLRAIPKDYKGYRKGAAINFYMGVETLKAVKNNEDVFYSDTPVKITHATRDHILADPLAILREEEE